MNGPVATVPYAIMKVVLGTGSGGRVETIEPIWNSMGSPELSTDPVIVFHEKYTMFGVEFIALHWSVTVVPVMLATE